MVQFESFRKDGARYSTVPYKRCTVPSEVFRSLCAELYTKYLRRSDGYKRIARRRCPYCDSFEEITIFYTFPNGDKIKTVYTVPLM